MEIRPFRGWRYRTDDGDVSRLIAPPYDILSAQDKADLLRADEHNIVAVDLPHVPPKELGPDEAYRAAADRLAGWKASGVLAAEDAPAVYVYDQTYTWHRRTYTRRAMICGVRATEFGRDVLAHEATFAGPKADRLRLTECTGMQLSPIFGVYNDPGGTVAGLLDGAAVGPCVCRGALRGVEEKLWAVSDARTVERIAAALAEQPAIVADGHHRYLTAVAYREALRAAGEIDEGHEANFALFALVAADHPGLLILPSHRVLRGLKAEFTVEALVANAPAFSWQAVCPADGDLHDAGGFLARFGPGAMGLFGAGSDRLWVGRLGDPAAMAAAAPDQVDAWRRLDVAVLHKLLIERALAPWAVNAPAIEYTPDGQAAVAACRSGSAQLAACLQATPIQAVEAVARSGSTMPHKSTYFYPKIAAGMVLKPLR